jgi:hypothetical protein
MTVEEKKEELVRTLRHYFMGVVDVKQVRNVFNCLFVDVLLEEKASPTKTLPIRGERTDFELFMKELI